MRPGTLAASYPVAGTERVKASVRARFDLYLHQINNQFGYQKVRYGSLMMNTNRLYLLGWH